MDLGRFGQNPISSLTRITVNVSISPGFLKRINRIEDWLFEHYRWQLFDRAIYAIGDIPNRAEPGILFIIFCSAIVVCLLGALLPSWKAAKQKPVETLQVNQV